MRVKLILKYLPVLSIVLVALTMLAIVVLFTLRNISVQNQRMEEFTSRQGVAVIRTLEAGTRTGFMEGDWGIEHLQLLIEQAARDPDVEWAGLINSDGIIVAHSEPAKIGLRLLMGKEMETVKAVIRTGEPLSYKVELPEGKTIFEIWKPFTPFPDQLAQNELIARHTRIGKELLDVFDREHKQVIFLGLKMDRFKEIRHQDLMFAILMGVVLFIIGSAGIYFVFVVQNAYLVRRTLDEMREYTRNVLESMPNGLLTVDRSLCVATFNPTALEILGRTREEIEGKPIDGLLPLENEVRQVLSDSESILEKEVRISHEARNKTFLFLSVSPLKEPDSKVARGAVIILRDVTMIRDLEQKVIMNEKFAALGRLSAGVAHEIRNPLNSIKGFIQYFQKKLDLDEEDYKYTDLMLSEVDRLNRVISKLLAYSKPREPRMSVRSLDEIVDHCILVLEREFSDASIRVERKCYQDQASMVLMDADQMTQVFLNILLNAIEATPRGGTISVVSEAGNDRKVNLVVKDTGEGIPREHLDKIFDPFFSTKKKGTGLGLAIVKSIIEAHGGEIDVESEVGKGTKFIVSLETYLLSNEMDENLATEMYQSAPV